MKELMITCPEKINNSTVAMAYVPGSKSITNRALLLAAVADGTSVLRGCMTSDDAKCFIDCLEALGFPVSVSDEGEIGACIEITGFGGKIPKDKANLYVGSAGTAARFISAMLAFSDGEYYLDASEQMKKRPMQPLLDALRQTGAEIVCTGKEGHFPLLIKGIGKTLSTNKICVNIDQSSQFLSALLIACGTLNQDITVEVQGSHGLDYVDMTVSMMNSFGVTVRKETTDGKLFYYLKGTNNYRPTTYCVEPDMSAAAYFYALAALLGAKVAVKGISLPMLQGDCAFFSVLEKLGCDVVCENGNILVSGPKDRVLHGGFCVDMSAFSDQALTLAAIAPFADAPITITGISHIRLQECDRITAIVKNITALGINVDEFDDGVRVYPGTPVGCSIETFDDHRVAMSFALIGLRVPNVRIQNPLCCKKTFAEYFDVLKKTVETLKF